MELNTISPHPIEVVYSVASLVAVVFTVYAIRKMAKREWTVAAGLTLILMSFVVPFGGPIIVLAIKLVNALRARLGANLS